MAQYRVSRNGEDLGTFDEGTIQAKLADGSILGTDLCFAEGSQEGVAAAHVVANAGASYTVGATPGAVAPQDIPRPPTHMASAIVATILCCLPLGIVAIIHSTKVSELYSKGDYHGALAASKKAKNWSNFAALAAIGLIALYMAYEKFVLGSL